MLTFPAGSVDSDMYVLALPLSAQLGAADAGRVRRRTVGRDRDGDRGVGRARDHGVERHRRAADAQAPRAADHRRRRRRPHAADGAARGHRRHPAAGLPLLPLGRRRAARLDRAAVVRRHRAARAGVLRRPVLEARDRARRHGRHDDRHRDLGLHAAAAELRRCRHRRLHAAERRAVGPHAAAAAGAVRARTAAAGAWRGVEPQPQHHRLYRLLADPRAGVDRTAAGRPVRALRPDADLADLPPVAPGGDDRGAEHDRRALSRRGAHPDLVRQLRLERAASRSIPRPRPTSSSSAMPSICSPRRSAPPPRAWCCRCCCASARCRPRPRSSSSTTPMRRSTTTAKSCRPRSTTSARASRSSTRTCT